MIEKTIGAHGIDRRRIYITGLSAGGAMAAAMLATYPEVFAAGAIIAGLPYGTAGNVHEAFESMFQGKQRSGKDWGDAVRRASRHRGPWPRVSIWHGDRDETVKPANADALIAQWCDVHGVGGAPVEAMVDGYPRKIWRRDGADVIESYTITGMAHGTPLDTHVHGGAAGPFLLEAGISSSYHIARFFGLAGAARQTVRAEIEAAPVAPDRVEFIPDERVEILKAETEEPKLGARRAGGIDVMAVITKALTSAGLIKPPA
jgi:poly(3-hydroxybutyrate) depolymerase